METSIVIFSFTILYLLIGVISWFFMANKRDDLESIHIFMFALFWPIILLAILYKYIILSIKELCKLLKNIQL